MSFFEGFLQGAAEAGAGIIDRQMQDESVLNRQKALADYAEQLEEKKQRTRMQLQAELGQKINDSADQAYRQRIADRINADNGSSMTADDAKEIARNPNAMKAYGIIERTRAQELDDKASAADKIGATDQAKMIRDQQNVEINRENNERRVKADEDRNKIAQAQIDQRDRYSSALLEQREKESDRRHSEAMARIDAMAAKTTSAGKGEKLLDYLNETRKAIDKEASEIRGLMESELKNVFSADERKAIRDKYQTQLDEVAKRKASWQEDADEARDRVGLKARKEADKQEKQPAQSGMKPITKAEYDKLKSGDTFMAPDGKMRRKP